MAAFNYQWSSEGMTQPSVAEIFSQFTTQLAELERKIDALGQQYIQNDYYQPQPNYPPNYYHPDWQNHPSYSWNNHPDQFYVSSLPYSPPQLPMQKSKLEEILDRFVENTEMSMTNQGMLASELSYPSYQQPPPLQKEKSNLEEILERMEESRKSQEATIQERQIKMEQYTSIIMNYLQSTSPSNAEIKPKEDSEKQCKVDTIESGEVFHETVKINLKRSRPDMEKDYELENKRSRIEKDEITDEDDQALNSNGIKQIPPVSISQQFNSTEYIRVDLGEGQIHIMDEFKFGGGLQSCAHALRFKEKTTRRHEKTIFAIEPD